MEVKVLLSEDTMNAFKLARVLLSIFVMLLVAVPFAALAQETKKDEDKKDKKDAQRAKKG